MAEFWNPTGGVLGEILSRLRLARLVRAILARLPLLEGWHWSWAFPDPVLDLLAVVVLVGEPPSNFFSRSPGFGQRVFRVCVVLGLVWRQCRRKITNENGE